MLHLKMRKALFKQQCVLLCLLFLVMNLLSIAAQQTDTVMAPLSTDTVRKQGFVGRVASAAFNKYFNDSSNPSEPKFLLYPTVAFSPETSWEIGISALMLYYARRDTTNRLSEITAFTFLTLNQQYGAWFDHFLYSHEDAWFFLGRLRFQRFPLQYFGIGPTTPKENKQTVDADYILIKERVLRRIRPNFFGGIEFDFQQISNTSIDQGTSSLPLPPGADGSTNIGLGVGLVYDSRHNAMNVRNGGFAELGYLQYNPKWGSTYKFNSLNIDSRFYRSYHKNQVLAVQALGQFMNGDVPFNQMALVGGETLMRGYYYGRYRDKNYIAAQAEYRFLPFPFSKRLGGAVFAAAGAVAPTVSAFNIKHIQPSGGVGLRYLLFPRKDIFVRFDAGMTREGINFYFYTGEAF